MIYRIGFSRPLAVTAHIAALLPITLYGLHHILYENVLIGGLLLASAFLLLISTYMVSREIENDIILQLFIIIITLTLIVTCYELGLRGAVFVFPLISAYFFAFKYNQALLFSCIASISCMIASLNSLDMITVARLSLGLGLTIFFFASFALLLSRQKENLKKEAMTDDLTGLLNRRSYHESLSKEIPSALKNDTLLALLYIDLNSFKKINDNYGHETGDAVLKITSQRMKNSIRADNVPNLSRDSIMISRLSGDEFCITVTNLNSKDEIVHIADRLLKSLNSNYHIGGLILSINASIGIAIAGEHGNTPDELIRNADAAMYKAKNDHSIHYAFFDHEIADEIYEISRIEQGLQQALDENRFYLVCMPIFHENTRDIAGVEVLVRCQPNMDFNYTPEKFIPVAERCGLIYEIDLWVIKSTLEHITKLRKTVDISGLFFCINISAKELLNEDIVQKLESMLKEYNIKPSQIDLEITETSLIGDLKKSVSILQKLKSLGFRLSLDDFGTGYMAFSQISNFPVDTLKIDRSFTNSIDSDDTKQKLMVNLILALANLYNLSIVAEGVESRAQLNYVKKLKCNFFQGFYLSKPVSWEELARKLTEQLKLPLEQDKDQAN